MTVVAERGGRLIGFLGSSDSRLDRLGEWFKAEYEPLLRFAYFLTADREEAEDLVQDAFLRIFRAGARVERRGFHSYARMTILNLARSRFRRVRIARRIETESPVTKDPADASASYDLRKALLRLPVSQRACLALRYYEDQQDEDIAEMLGISRVAVRKQIERAMKALRLALKEEELP